VSRRMQNRGRARGLLHVSALPTFAMRWLIPRLPDFQRNHPGLELRLASLLSLGAIDFGIVGDSIVMTKAILRLREAKPDEPHTEDGILCPHHPSPAHKSPRDFLRARPRSPTQPP